MADDEAKAKAEAEEKARKEQVKGWQEAMDSVRDKGKEPGHLGAEERPETADSKLSYREQLDRKRSDKDDRHKDE
jgi:hypothetical protein